MREIKFRALRDDMSDCNYVYGFISYSANGTPRIFDGEGNLNTSCIKGTEGQYTGLKDKNGKEIYEGDILVSKVFIKPIYGVMEWQDDGARWSQFSPLNHFEVCGNIHDNPELLA